MKTLTLPLSNYPRIVSLNPTVASDGSLRPEVSEDGPDPLRRIGAVVIPLVGVMSIRILRDESAEPWLGLIVPEDRTIEFWDMPEDLTGLFALITFGAPLDAQLVGARLGSPSSRVQN